MPSHQRLNTLGPEGVGEKYSQHYGKSI